FKDVADEAYRRVQTVIDERNPDLATSERHEVARRVGLGAIAFSLLEVDNVRDIIFDYDVALSFDGKSAPYIQNAYVRANSILKKAGGTPPATDFDYKLEPSEVELVDLIARFPGVVQ